ncbi:gluconate 2-dehydrogenase subunit 3 family protein [Pseudomonas corrugata]|uniref:gluconate 2-dehydrogenase subunit 3 family protein n=1 Tax=Pseudomonas corrugata TaxID=47879 RepID=UPI003D813316
MSWTQTSQAEGLTPEQLAQLAVLMDRLLPGDARRGIPSAGEVGAANFVSRLLGRTPDVYHETSAWRTLYPIALAGLDGYALSQFGRPLTGLTQAEVDFVLNGLQVSGLPGIAAADQKVWFKTLLRHCYQGCFGDPRWGGNRGAKMWRAIGYPLLPATEDA